MSWSTGGEVVVAATTRVKKEAEDVKRRRAALKMVDRQLTKGNFKSALSLVKHLPCIRGFAAATQISQRVSSVKQLYLISVTETSTLQSLLDAILHSIKTSLHLLPLEESCVTSEENYLYYEASIVDHKQVALHEAGHFLVGYLLGVLPKQYTFSCTEDKIADANVKFIGFEFLTELEDVPSNKKLRDVKPGHRASKRKLSSTVLRKFACVIVGGLVAEYLAFGYAKGHHGDVEKLVKVLKWLQYTEDEAYILTRWAVLNTLTILRRHSKAISTLADAMLHGRSTGYCIDVIETNLNHQNI